MAKDKKSFLIYCDLIHTVKKLSKENAGELFLHLLEYVNDLSPETENPIVDIVFEPIKQQLKRDLKAYDKALEDRSLNGRIGNLKRWNNDLYLRFENKEITIEEAENIANHRKTSPPDSTQSPPIANVAVTDTVTVTGNVTVKEIKEEIIETASPFSFYNSLIQSGGEIQLVSDWLKVRKNKKATNTQTAYSSFLKEVEKSKLSINQVLFKCVENSWSGFKSEWNSSTTSTTNTNSLYTSNGTVRGVL